MFKNNYQSVLEFLNFSSRNEHLWILERYPPKMTFVQFCMTYILRETAIYSDNYHKYVNYVNSFLFMILNYIYFDVKQKNLLKFNKKKIRPKYCNILLYFSWIQVNEWCYTTGFGPGLTLYNQKQ